MAREEEDKSHRDTRATMLAQHLLPQSSQQQHLSFSLSRSLDLRENPRRVFRRKERRVLCVSGARRVRGNSAHPPALLSGGRQREAGKRDAAILLPRVSDCVDEDHANYTPTDALHFMHSASLHHTPCVSSSFSCSSFTLLNMSLSLSLFFFSRFSPSTSSFLVADQDACLALPRPSLAAGAEQEARKEGDKGCNC